MLEKVNTSFRSKGDRSAWMGPLSKLEKKCVFVLTVIGGEKKNKGV